MNQLLLFKMTVGKGYLITEISDEFKKYNTNKLVIGDIICEIEKSTNISQKIVFKDCNSEIVKVGYYRFIQNTCKWEKYIVDITPIEMTYYDNFII